MIRYHWSQDSYGDTLDGDRVMLVKIESEYPGRRRFPAVLICRPDGLYRQWRNGRMKLLEQGFVWPLHVRRGDDEKSLGSFVPAFWGTQRNSGCVLQKIPGWIVRAKTDNMARLLIAWYFVEYKADWARVTRVDQPLRAGSELPVSPLWRPVAITTMPCTDVVVRAINTGALLQRLKLGLERIYVSEQSWIRAPRIEASLRALAHRFPSRLVLVKAQSYGRWAAALRLKRVRAQEYQFVGGSLQSQYEDDFGFEKYWNEAPLAGMLRFRIGDVPRGITFMFLHEMQLDFEEWVSLDVDGMLQVEEKARERRNAQDNRASEALGRTLKANRSSQGHDHIDDKKTP